MNKHVIVLAAGKGLGMCSRDPEHSKVSFPILGKPIINYVIDAVKGINPDNIVTVVGFGGEITSQLVGKDSLVVWQKDIKGTGHAVNQCKDILKEKEGITLVIYGDTPLIPTSTINKIIRRHEKNNNVLTIVTAVLNDPSGYGRIIREEKSNKVLAIREETDCLQEQLEINEVNTGICVVDNKLLFKYIDQLSNNNKRKLYYLSELVEIFNKEGLKVDSFVAKEMKEVFGINNRIQLAYAAKLMRKRINNALMLNGVSIEDPDTTYISPNVIIGKDTIILPNTTISGSSVIGEGNMIGPNTYLKDVEIGDENTITSSYLIETKVGNHNEIGPYAKTRSNTVIENNCRVGNFVELKNSHYHNGVKSAHLTYIGDTEVGEKTNVGCGTITANYNGFNKFHSEIGKEVFLGSGSILVGPIKVEDQSFIAAGSTITKDVHQDELVIARSREVILEHGYTRFRNKAKAISETSKKAK